MPVKRLFKSESFAKTVFFLSLFLIIFISGLAYKHIVSLSKSTDLVMDTYKISLELEQVLSYLKDAETGHRGFIVTNDSMYLEPYVNGRKNINNSLAEIKALTLEDSIQRKNLLALGKIIDARLDNFEVENKYAKQKGTSSSEFKNAFLDGKSLMDKIRDQLKKMIGLETNRLKKQKEANQDVLDKTPLLLYGLVLFTLLIIYFSYNRTIKNIETLKVKNQELGLFKKATMQSEKINKVGSWRWNIQSDKFLFSENLFRLLGEEPYSFEQTPEAFYKFVHPDDTEKLAEQVEAMKANKDLSFVYFRVIHKDGKIRHLKSFGKAVTEDDGSMQLLGTTTDITDEIDNMHLLEQRNLELEQNNKELQAFNYVASHDLQEPLRKIQTFLSILEDKETENLSDSSKKYFERINNAATRMRQLIDDLLQFSRTNKFDEALSPTNLNELLEAAKEDLAEVILEQEVKITADKLPTANVIPFQIQQLFTNLIGNSIKYSKKDIKPIIKINYEFVKSESDYDDTLSEKNDYHEIIFTDNGIGFAPEYAEQIFVLFSRLHNKDEYSGTGIGLSICKKIMDNHRGTIKAESQAGKGAKFIIQIPA